MEIDSRKETTQADPSRIFVFLGPTLPQTEARTILPAIYQRPATCGDILRTCRLRPAAILLIDGGFEQTAAVWHKEILYALDKAIPVFGASSMGALRAAELHSFGMIGVGSVFEQFRDGQLRDDDEVAVLHADETWEFRQLSTAMVDIRATADQALRNGILTQTIYERIITTAKARFYGDRHLPDILKEIANDTGVTESLEHFLQSLSNGGFVAQKEADARLLLEKVARSFPLAVGKRPVTMHRSIFFRRLCVETLCTPLKSDDCLLPVPERVLIRSSKDTHAFGVIQRLATILVVAHVIATQTTTSEPEFVEDWLSQLGVTSKESQWRKQNDVEPAEWADIDKIFSRISRWIQQEEKRLEDPEGRALKFALNFARISGDYSDMINTSMMLSENCSCRKRALSLIGRLWSAVDLAAAHAEISSPPRRLQRFADDFRKVRGLRRKIDTERWLRDMGINHDEFFELMRCYDRLMFLCDGFNVQAIAFTIPAIETICWALQALRLTDSYRMYRETLEPSSVGSCSNG